LSKPTSQGEETPLTSILSPKGRGVSSGRREVIVAMQGSKPIPIGTLKSIIEGSGLDLDDFR
jgi:hypothetical protein